MSVRLVRACDRICHKLSGQEAVEAVLRGLHPFRGKVAQLLVRVLILHESLVEICYRWCRVQSCAEARYILPVLEEVEELGQPLPSTRHHGSRGMDAQIRALWQSVQILQADGLHEDVLALLGGFMADLCQRLGLCSPHQSLVSLRHSDSLYYATYTLTPNASCLPTAPSASLTPEPAPGGAAELAVRVSRAIMAAAESPAMAYSRARGLTPDQRHRA